MFPVAELFNHNIDLENVVYTYDANTREYVFYSSRDIEVGSQMYSHYGCKSQMGMVLMY
jgi:hypothetical protein